MNRIDQMKTRLSTLKPSHLEIIDDSEHHKGHAGAESGMGHYTVLINSPEFEGKSLVQQHQLIYQALGDMMKTEIHALKISILRDKP